MNKLLTVMGALFLSLLFVSSASAESHTIKKGETIDDVAKRYSVTVKTLLELNDIEKKEAKTGYVLKLPKHITDTSKYKDKPKKKTESKAEEPKEKTYRMVATAYTAYCKGCSGITKTGIDLRENPDAKVVAVDPKVIPLGSKVWVEGYGNAVAGDIGGAIKGKKIDIHVKNKATAYNWGRRTVTVKVYN
ncbi:MAG: 3D domain-containing protein [Solibacillus sp.]